MTPTPEQRAAELLAKQHGLDKEISAFLENGFADVWRSKDMDEIRTLKSIIIDAAIAKALEKA